MKAHGSILPIAGRAGRRQGNNNKKRTAIINQCCYVDFTAAYLDHILREIDQFGDMYAETLIHNALPDQIQQSEYTIVGQHGHMIIFHRRHTIGQFGDFVEMRGE